GCSLETAVSDTSAGSRLAPRAAAAIRSRIEARAAAASKDASDFDGDWVTVGGSAAAGGADAKAREGRTEGLAAALLLHRPGASPRPGGGARPPAAGRRRRLSRIRRPGPDPARP